jgi:uncharacterized membrane protein
MYIPSKDKTHDISIELKAKAGLRICLGNAAKVRPSCTSVIQYRVCGSVRLILGTILTEMMDPPSIVRHAQCSILFLFTLRVKQAKGMKKESKRKEKKREKTGRTKINKLKKKHEIE